MCSVRKAIKATCLAAGSAAVIGVFVGCDQPQPPENEPAWQQQQPQEQEQEKEEQTKPQTLPIEPSE